MTHKGIGECFHKLLQRRALLDPEDLVYRSVVVIEVVALVPTEAVFQQHLHRHVQMGLVALLPPYLLQLFLLL